MTTHTKRYLVLPYRQGSRGAKALATSLGGKVLKLQGSSYTEKDKDVVINWGNTDPPSYMTLVGHLNDFAILKHATNKRNFFQMMKDQGHDDIVPRFWTSKADVPEDAYPVVCRTSLAGHSGDGIVIAASADELVDAPLYVQYVKKQEEYRVHVGRRTNINPCGEMLQDGDGSWQPNDELVVIAIQRKARRLSLPDSEVNWQVRNHQNGFVYVRQDVTPPASVLEVSRRALLASGLDFGAVDVIWNEKKQKAYVLEINTAPGLEGQTVTDYANFFKGVT